MCQLNQDDDAVGEDDDDVDEDDDDDVNEDDDDSEAWKGVGGQSLLGAPAGPGSH